MHVIVHLKNNDQSESLLKIIKNHDSVEWMETYPDMETNEVETYHKELIDQRLESIDKGTAIFTDWDLIKKKYDR